MNKLLLPLHYPQPW